MEETGGVLRRGKVANYRIELEKFLTGFGDVKAVVEEARFYPEKSSREIACYVTDELSYSISESSVYRILKAKNLVTAIMRP